MASGGSASSDMPAAQQKGAGGGAALRNGRRGGGGMASMRVGCCAHCWLRSWRLGHALVFLESTPTGGKGRAAMHKPAERVRSVW